jgi:hypothetical protein
MISALAGSCFCRRRRAQAPRAKTKRFPQPRSARDSSSALGILRPLWCYSPPRPPHPHVPVFPRNLFPSCCPFRSTSACTTCSPPAASASPSASTPSTASSRTWAQSAPPSAVAHAPRLPCCAPPTRAVPQRHLHRRQHARQVRARGVPRRHLQHEGAQGHRPHFRIWTVPTLPPLSLLFPFALRPPCAPNPPAPQSVPLLPISLIRPTASVIFTGAKSHADLNTAFENM